MLKSSSVSRATRTAFRALGVVFVLLTALLAYFIVERAVWANEFRSDLLLYAVYTAGTAVGLFGVQKWGRSMALLFALGNLSLGILWLVSAAIGGQPLIGAIVFIVLDGMILGVLTRPFFTLPDEA